MTRAYSFDLRERIVAAFESGEICRAAAKRFGVAVSPVVKWSGHWRETGSFAPGGVELPKASARVEQILVPTLKPGDIVIMDNTGSHKSKAVRDAIRGAGARLWVSPPYSPDLNPIEQTFPKIKHRMRMTAQRIVEETWKRAGKLVETVKPEECANYSTNAGYASV